MKPPEAPPLAALVGAVVAGAVLLVAFAAGLSGPSLPVTGGEVGQVDLPPTFPEAIFGYVNVTGHLFNVSVSSMSLGPYALNQVPGGNRKVVYAVVCYEVDACVIGFYVINDSVIHDYVGTVKSVPVDLHLSDGYVARGSVTVQNHSVAGPQPSGSLLIAWRWTFFTSGRITSSNVSAVIPLNDSIASSIAQVTIGSQTVDSSFFTRQTTSAALPNGTEQIILGPLTIRGPTVYYVMENAGRTLPVTLWLESGDRVNLTLLAVSWVFSYLQQ